MLKLKCSRIEIATKKRWL